MEKLKNLSQRELVVLGAFLHDIGKFSFRAQQTKSDDTHEKLGEEFIRENLGKIVILRDDIEHIISTSKTRYGSIWLADTFSAEEREKDTSKETRRQLLSILSRLKIKKENNYAENKVYFFDPEPLKQEYKFPESKETNIHSWKVNDEEVIEKHKKSLELFKEEINKLHSLKNFRNFFTTFVKLCEKYTARVCSAGYLSVPDISLFDHSRIVSALALCYEDTQNQTDNQCLVIKGDISGIQNFIYYDIEEAEKASKQLRGRSLYLNLMADAVATHILDELALYETNLFFCSGGNFLIIAPNTKENKTKVEEIEKNVNLGLFKEFGIRLQLILSAKSFTVDELVRNCDEVMEKIELELQKAKKQKSYTILENLFENNIEFNFNEKIFEEIGKKLPHSDYLIEIIYDDVPLLKQTSEQDRDILFEYLRVGFKLAHKNELEGKLSTYKNANYIKRVIVHSIKNTDFLPQKELIHNFNEKVGFSFKFIANHIPFDKKDKYKPLSFQDIAYLYCEEENNSAELRQNNTKIEKTKKKIYPMLGIARLDVDNLGRLFNQGLKLFTEGEEPLYKLSRIATLSRELHHFFCGHINTIASRNDIYLVYAGGDDVFAVGHWYDILKFLQELYDDFRKFACDNPDVTISCGAIITKHNYPIAESAQKSGEELEKSKENYLYNKEDPEKNSITIFYRTVFWDEFKSLLNMGKKLEEIISDSSENNKVNRGFIHSLLEMTQQCFDKNGKFKIDQVFKTTARMHYHFGRRGFTNKELENIDNYKKELAMKFLKTSPEERKNWYKNFAIPASYVLLKTRKFECRRNKNK